jgi:hypothetical protein
MSGLLDNGSELYQDYICCPFCEYDKQEFHIGKNECNNCNGKFKVSYDTEQEIYIIEKDLK